MKSENKVKYGVVLYKDTDNIGDDIQTFATARFLPQVDYVIDRENISGFVPEHDCEVVKVIMNGWYNHHKYRFLPSPYIDPLLISMHFSNNDLVLNPGYKFLDGYAKESLKEFFPLGCRDWNTKEKLDSLGYDTYFSGCATLTLDPIGKKSTKDYICAVDMKPEIVDHLKKVMGCEVKEISHWLLEFHSDDLSYEEKQQEIRKYTLQSYEERARWVEKHAKLSYQERMKKVEDLLTIYQNAKLVVTDRIHVALPCIALKTPVLLIYYEHNADRIETFKEYIVHCTEEEFFGYQKKQLSSIKNKEKYQEVRKNILESIHQFLESDSRLKDKILPPVSWYQKEVISRLNEKDDLFLDKILSQKEEISKLRKELDQLMTQCKGLQYQNERQGQEIERLSSIVDEYQKIQNSFTWKYIGKYYQKKLQNNHKES